MAESSQTLDVLLTLPPGDAIDRLMEMADPLELLRDVLKRVTEGRYAAGPGMLVAASVLAKSDVRAALLQPTYDLGQIVLSQTDARRDPTVAEKLRSLLAQLEERFARSNEIDAARRRHIIAQLSRARAMMALDAGETGEGQALLVEALEQYEQLENKSGIAALALDLSGVEWSLNDASASVEYLIKASDQLSDEQPAGAQGLQKAILGALVGRAESLYYDLQDPASAIRLARRATELAPTEASPWQLLANALMREKKYASAIEAYERLTALDPEELTSARANLAAAFVALGREEEALAAVSESLRLRPGRVRSLVLRGQLREDVLHDTDGAVEDLEATIALLEADRPIDNEHDAAATQAYREHWKMWLAAYSRLVAIHQQRNDLDALRKIIARLKETGDDALSAMGHRLSADLARDAGCIDEAAREYDMALAAFPLDSVSSKARALLAAETEDADSAVAQLARLTPRDRDPKAAIEGLNIVGARFPDDRRVQRWLGFAYFELGEFEPAETNLDAYLAAAPEDVEARRWLGLSLISAERKKPQPRKDGQRCFRGLDELARAASQGDAESKRSLLWVVDRLLLKFGFLNFYLLSARTVLDALPGVEDFVHRVEPALMGGRDYEKRIQAFTECIPIAAKLELPCYAAHLHFMAGDIELVRGNTQSARDHLREAQKLQSLVFRPRSTSLEEQHEAVVQEYALNVTIEEEHVHIYDKATEALLQVRNLAARIDAAAGVLQQIDGGLGDIKSIVSYVETIPALEAMPIVLTLRDAGRLEDALLVLDRVEQRSGRELNDRERGEVLVTRATVLAMKGDLPEASKAIRAAEPLLDENRRWVAWMNIASYAEAAGMYAEALRILDQIDIERVARSDQDRFKYQYLKAIVLEKSERLREAFTAAEQAIATLESLRAGLKDIDLRSSWAGQRETGPVYALAVRLAIALGRTRSVFDLIESSRSRLFIDEIAMGRGVADDEGLRLARQVRYLEDKREILQTMVSGDDRQALRSDALIRLKDLDPNLKLVRLNENGVEYIAAEDLERAQKRTEYSLEDARNKVVAHRVQTAQNLYGEVVGFEACKNLLASLGRAVLVEFVVQERDTLACLVRAGLDEPIVARTLQDIDVGAWARDLVRRFSDVGAGAGKLDQSPLTNLLELVETQIDEGDVLCIVPNGALHLVPFHALRLSCGYLVDRNPVVYAPSASVLASVIRRSSNTKYSGALVVGDTRGDLAYADREARAVARLLDTAPLTPRQATRRGLQEALSRTPLLRILHLACHGYFDTGDALSSGILATNNDEAGRPAVLSARDLLEMEFQSDLVALSACQSGLSDVSPGDELMGLNRALLVAGARTVLGSLWRVNDLSTNFLMRFFYEGWVTEGLSKAEALRRAQRRLMNLTRQEVQDVTNDESMAGVRDLGAPSLKSAAAAQPNDRVFATAAHWAAFSLVGDWR
jgi:CHAT domain-containing protein/Flp pilus assembly protein TadD